MIRWLVFGWLAIAVDVAHAQAQDGDTMLTPRGREAYEQHLKELNAKYGVRSEQEALKEAVLAANGKPSGAIAPGSSVAVPADVAPGQRLRIELLAHAGGQFLFQDQVYDTSSLNEALQRVKRTYVIDQVVLLSEDERPIQVDHLVGLARLSRDLAVTAAYEQGGQLKIISAQ
jgi:hypothetical protein